MDTSTGVHWATLMVVSTLTAQQVPAPDLPLGLHSKSPQLLAKTYVPWTDKPSNSGFPHSIQTGTGRSCLRTAAGVPRLRGHPLPSCRACGCPGKGQMQPERPLLSPTRGLRKPRQESPHRPRASNLLHMIPTPGSSASLVTRPSSERHTPQPGHTPQLRALHTRLLHGTGLWLLVG